VKAAKLLVVSDGFNRYPEQSGLFATRKRIDKLGGTAEREASFVPDVDEGFFVFIRPMSLRRL
jgi:hypothetical protein